MDRRNVAGLILLGLFVAAAIGGVIYHAVHRQQSQAICIATATHVRVPSGDCRPGDPGHAAWYIYSGSLPRIGAPVTGGAPTATTKPRGFP